MSPREWWRDFWHMFGWVGASGLMMGGAVGLALMWAGNVPLWEGLRAVGAALALTLGAAMLVFAVLRRNG